MPGKDAEVMVGDRMDNGDGADGDMGETLEAAPEEVDPRRHIATPTLPNAIEIARHREDHLPYQSWCDQCVEGRGREFGHHAVNHGAREVPTIAFDYLFVNDRGMFTREELEAAGIEKAGQVKILVVKDCKSKCTFGHVRVTNARVTTYVGNMHARRR